MKLYNTQPFHAKVNLPQDPMSDALGLSGQSPALNIKSLPTDEKDRLYRRSLKKKAKSDFKAFCQYCFKDKQNKYWRLQPFQHEWIDLISKYDRIILMAPTETGKTDMLTIAYSIWRLGNNPDLRIAIISNVAKQASKFLRAVEDNITDNPYVREVFPNLKPKPDTTLPNRWDKWSDFEMIVQRPHIDKDPSVQAVGIGGPLIGSRIDLMILDDILNKKNTLTEYQMQETNRWFDAVVATRLTEACKLIAISPPWHPQDMMHHLSAKPGYMTFKYSIYKEDEADGYRLATWKDKWTPELIQKWIDDMGIYDFNRFKRCRIEAKEINPFTLSLGNIITRDTQVLDRVTRSWMKFQGTDFSSASRAGTCIITIAVSPYGEIIAPYDIEYGAWKPKEVGSKLCDHYEKHKPMFNMAENNSIQEALLEWGRDEAAKRGIHLPLKPFTTGRNKADANIGVASLSVDMENGYITIYQPPGHQLSCRCHFCRFVNELRAYPGGTYDGVMAFWFARQAYREITKKAKPNVRIISFSPGTSKTNEEGKRDIEAELLGIDDQVIFDAEPRDYNLENRITLSRGYIPGPNHKDILGRLRKLNYKALEKFLKGESMDSNTNDRYESLAEELSSYPMDEVLEMAMDIYYFCFTLRYGTKKHLDLGKT